MGSLLRGSKDTRLLLLGSAMGRFSRYDLAPYADLVSCGLEDVKAVFKRFGRFMGACGCRSMRGGVGIAPSQQLEQKTPAALPAAPSLLLRAELV